MKSILQFFLFLSSSVPIGARHYALPEETDVESPPFVVCETDEFGFAGIPLSDESNSTIRFNYAVKYFSTNNLDDIIFETERRIANHLLAETTNFQGCGNRRRAQSIFTGGLRSSGHRRLQAKAVAITVNPPDFDTEISCDEFVAPAVDGQSCAIIDGAFTVYFDADLTSEGEITQNIKADVQEAMDLGKLDGGEITTVSWIDSIESRSPPSNEINEGETVPVQPVDSERNGSTSVIIGASVGGLLAIGLLAFYRRRSLKNGEDDIFTAGPGDSTVGPDSNVA